MAIVKWKGKVYSFTFSWQLLVLAVLVMLAAVLPVLRAVRDFFVR